MQHFLSASITFDHLLSITLDQVTVAFHLLQLAQPATAVRIYRCALPFTSYAAGKASIARKEDASKDASKDTSKDTSEGFTPVNTRRKPNGKLEHFLGDGHDLSALVGTLSPGGLVT